MNEFVKHTLTGIISATVAVVGMLATHNNNSNTAAKDEQIGALKLQLYAVKGQMVELQDAANAELNKARNIIALYQKGMAELNQPKTNATPTNAPDVNYTTNGRALNAGSAIVPGVTNK